MCVFFFFLVFCLALVEVARSAPRTCSCVVCRHRRPDDGNGDGSDESSSARVATFNRQGGREADSLTLFLKEK